METKKKKEKKKVLSLIYIQYQGGYIRSKEVVLKKIGVATTAVCFVSSCLRSV
jgi:hypothetical protein